MNIILKNGEVIKASKDDIRLCRIHHNSFNEKVTFDKEESLKWLNSSLVSNYKDVVDLTDFSFKTEKKVDSWITFSYVDNILIAVSGYCYPTYVFDFKNRDDIDEAFLERYHLQKNESIMIMEEYRLQTGREYVFG